MVLDMYYDVGPTLDYTVAPPVGRYRGEAYILNRLQEIANGLCGQGSYQAHPDSIGWANVDEFAAAGWNDIGSAVERIIGTKESQSTNRWCI